MTFNTNQTLPFLSPKTFSIVIPSPGPRPPCNHREIAILPKGMRGKAIRQHATQILLPRHQIPLPQALETPVGPQSPVQPVCLPGQLRQVPTAVELRVILLQTVRRRWTRLVSGCGAINTGASDPTIVVFQGVEAVAGWREGGAGALERFELEEGGGARGRR